MLLDSSKFTAHCRQNSFLKMFTET